MAKLSIKPRDEAGRFLPIYCDDPNCDGELQFEVEYGQPRWICNGLTHDRPDGPLLACARSYCAGSSALLPHDQGGTEG